MNKLTPRQACCVVGGVCLTLVVTTWALFLWWNRPPQLGPDDEVFKSVDALFTAITARDEKLLADCQRRLRTLKDAARLPTDASTYLDRIIKKARDGNWESAAERLYDYMRAQRRDVRSTRKTGVRHGDS
jgi:hypothetical protein